ncbi:MAG: heparinase II/III family protein [Candidatus Cloacimonetes bacterium]|nr:heparinase II/III family protein [Candidatus Cloacimonadota bacterium]
MFLKEKLIKIKGLPLHIIIKKLIRKSKESVYFFFRRYYIYLFNDSFLFGDFKNFKSDMNSFFHDEVKDTYKSFIINNLLKEKVIEEADKVSSHVFKILDLAEIQLDAKINWNEDFFSCFQWHNKFYKDIKICNLEDNSDVKIPWEMSRFQHLVCLGKGFLLSKDKKYSDEFVAQFTDWIEKNPYEYSVNWTCAMEVAIRAVNLTVAYELFKTDSTIDNHFWIKFNKVLFLHGRFVYNNLTNKDRYNNNHLIAELSALVILGKYFKDLKVFGFFSKPNQWFNHGILNLEKEMQAQVNEDGTSYEGSTSYHKLITEMFLQTTIICNLNGISLSESFNKRLERMCDFIMNIQKDNGLSPFIGDSDDGRYVILSSYYNRNPKDFNYLLSLAGEYFNRDDFRYFGQKNKQESYIFRAITHDKINVSLVSKAYTDGGYYLLRNDNVYCFIRCGQLALRGKGMHSHNDQLSIELSIKGKDFFIDPGSYVYTSDYLARNELKSTKSHNTLMVDNIEQNYFFPKLLFFMQEETFAECLSYKEDLFTGRHFGYLKKCGIIHQRSVNISQNNVRIFDELLYLEKDNNRIPSCINFILHQNVTIDTFQKSLVLTNNDVRIKLSCDIEYDIEDIFVSHSYGTRNHSKRISFKLLSDNNIVNIDF